MNSKLLSLVKNFRPATWNSTLYTPSKTGLFQAPTKMVRVRCYEMINWCWLIPCDLSNCPQIGFSDPYIRIYFQPFDQPVYLPFWNVVWEQGNIFLIRKFQSTLFEIIFWIWKYWKEFGDFHRSKASWCIWDARNSNETAWCETWLTSVHFGDIYYLWWFVCGVALW